MRAALSLRCLAAAVLVTLACGDPAGPEAESISRLLLIPCDSITESCGQEGFLFGHPSDACFGPSGEVLILDQAAARVYAFQRDGRLISSFGGPGEAPGEMGNPMSIEVVEGLILVRDAVKHGYLLFDSDYDLVREVAHWPSGSPTDMVFCGDSSFISLSTSFERSGDDMMLRRTVDRYRLGEAEPEATYWSTLDPLDPSDVSDLIRMATESLAFTADTSGTVYVSEISGEEYLVRVFGAGGEETGSLRRDLDPVPKTQEQLDREIAFMEAEMEVMGVEGLDEWVPDPFRQMITGLGTDSIGRLWVQRGTGERPVFDIYESHSFEEPGTEAVLPDSGYSWTFRISQDGIIAWETDPPDGMYVFYILETEP